jgi:hypothetical protein
MSPEFLGGDNARRHGRPADAAPPSASSTRQRDGV